ncbi:MAG: HlyC/CorC family transporter [Candidatus Hydrogenedentes bacterium]|nr:HlyC/CorC family transporter [Candidatus Hydrogenedentota bacterium]
MALFAALAGVPGAGHPVTAEALTAHAASGGAARTPTPIPWTDLLPPGVLVIVAVLLAMSAFFSGSETAFFSIHRFRLRSLREGPSLTGHVVASLMDRPSQFLTTILLGNMIVNVLIGVLLAARVEDVFERSFLLPGPAAYLLAVASCTAVLVLFGEIAPKVFAVHAGESFARLACLPLVAISRILAPIRDSLLRCTDALFAVTRFNELRAAPFITDDELIAALSDGEAHGAIEEDERQMIQGILEFSDAVLREILVPRPDVIAVPEDATVGDALVLLREHEYSRMPVYREDLDHVIGLLVAKDLLPHFASGDLDAPVAPLIRPAHFVPETMTVQQFVNDAQRHRAHLAVVVDEYGGTAGIVTLENAIEQVVGDILDEDEHPHAGYQQLEPGVYRIEGGLSLDELNELIGSALEDDEHETVAGFLMNQIDKVPEPGDQVDFAGIRFIVEACDGRRVSSLRIQILPPSAPWGAGS